MLDLSEITSPAVLAAGVFVGSFVAGFAGFGLAAAAGAVLLHVHEPSTAIPLMMVCSVVAQTVGLVTLRKAIDWRSSLPFVLGGVAGVPLALAVFHRIDADTFRLGFGLFLVAYAGQALLLHAIVRRTRLQALPAGSVASIAGPPPPAAARAGGAASVVPVAVGFGAGFVGGLTAMPGALVSVWCDLQPRSKENRRGVIQPFILAMQLLALVMMATSGALFQPALMVATAFALPFVAAGTALGLHLYGRIDSGSFRLVVLAIVLASGAGLVAR